MTPLTPIRYAKVRIEGVPHYLMLTCDNGTWLSGYEVGKDGTRTDVSRLHMIARQAITTGEVSVTPMRMNLHYGTLEAIKHYDGRRTGLR